MTSRSFQKEMHPSLEVQRKQPCGYLDFRLLTARTVRKVFRHQVRGNLLQQQQGTHTVSETLWAHTRQPIGKILLNFSGKKIEIFWGSSSMKRKEGKVKD